MNDILSRQLGKELVGARRGTIGSRRNQLALWIGRLIISFNELEHRLSNLIGEEVDKTGAEIADMLAASMSFGQKLDFLAALMHRRHAGDERHLARIRKICSAISAAEEFRNTVAHSHWMEPAFLSTDFVRRKPKTRGRKGLKVDSEKANVQEIKAAVQDIWFLGALSLHVMRSPQVLASYSIDENAFDAIAARLTRKGIRP